MASYLTLFLSSYVVCGSEYSDSPQSVDFDNIPLSLVQSRNNSSRMPQAPLTTPTPPDTEPPVGDRPDDMITDINAPCDNQESLSISFTYSGEIRLVNLKVGSCDQGDLIVESHGMKHTVTVNPQICMNETTHNGVSVTGFSYELPVSFIAGINTFGIELMGLKHTFMVSCNFGSEYITSYTFDQIDMGVQDDGTVDGGSLQFVLKAFTDKTYSVEHNSNVDDPMEAGTMAYMEISPTGNYDDDRFTFRPKYCYVEEPVTSMKYTLFNRSLDASKETCDNDALYLSMKPYENTWRIKYMIFLFQLREQVSYVLTCAVELCLANPLAPSVCDSLDEHCGDSDGSGGSHHMWG